MGSSSRNAHMASREGPWAGHPRNLTSQEGFLEEESTRRQKQGASSKSSQSSTATAVRAEPGGVGGVVLPGHGDFWKPYMRKHDYGHMATMLLRDNSFSCGLQDP